MAPGRTFCRLTVLAPRRRVDVALPADVSVAELVPMLLELVGEPVGDRWRPLPWRLTGAVGGLLPAGATLAELGVPDGELLRLAPAGTPPPAPVFDDPIDALASSAGRAGPGDRRFAAVALLVLATAAAGLLVTTGPDPLPASLAAGAAAVAALARAAWLVRPAPPSPPSDPAGPAVEDPIERAHTAAVTAALMAVPLAAAAGWTALPGAAGPDALLLAVGAAGVAAVAGQVVVRVVEPALIGVVLAAVLASAGIVGLRFGASPQAAAAAVAGVAIAAGPVLPRVAIRLAGLPRPVIPSGGGELADADAGPDLLPPEELAERADLARGYLAGLAGAGAVLAAAGAVVAASVGGWLGPTFAGVTVAVLGLRARGFADPVPARTSMTAAIGGGIALAGYTATHEGVQVPVPAALGLLLVAAIGLLVLGRPGAQISPVTRRAVDVVEGMLVAAAIPLALGVMDVYRVVRSL